MDAKILIAFTMGLETDSFFSDQCNADGMVFLGAELLYESLCPQEFKKIFI